MGMVGRIEADAPPQAIFADDNRNRLADGTPAFMSGGALKSLQLPLDRIPVRCGDHDQLRGTNEWILRGGGLSGGNRERAGGKQ